MALTVTQPWLATAQTNSPFRIVDLTHSFDNDTIYWPTEEGFRLIRGKAGVTQRGYYYAANRFTAAEHGGTHIDAPIHFFADRQTADQIPLERLIGDAVVVDVSESCAANRPLPAARPPWNAIRSRSTPVSHLGAASSEHRKIDA